MKIGDKVRFLSSTGGGVIAGFKGKIVWLKMKMVFRFQQ